MTKATTTMSKGESGSTDEKSGASPSIREGDKVDEKAFKALIRATVALNTSARAQKKPSKA